MKVGIGGLAYSATHGRRRPSTAVATTLAIGLLTLPCHGEEGMEESSALQFGPAPAAIGVAADYRLAIADFCSRDFEVADCGSQRSFVGGELSARWQMNERWMLGPVASFAIETESRESTSRTLNFESAERTTTQTSQLASLGLEARNRPYDAGFWLGPRVSLLLLREASEAGGGDGGGEGGLDRSSSDFTWGTELGGSIGYEWWPLARVGLRRRWTFRLHVDGIVGRGSRRRDHIAFIGNDARREFWRRVFSGRIAFRTSSNSAGSSARGVRAGRGTER